MRHKRAFYTALAVAALASFSIGLALPIYKKLQERNLHSESNRSVKIVARFGLCERDFIIALRERFKYQIACVEVKDFRETEQLLKTDKEIDLVWLTSDEIPLAQSYLTPLQALASIELEDVSNDFRDLTADTQSDYLIPVFWGVAPSSPASNLVSVWILGFGITQNGEKNIALVKKIVSAMLAQDVVSSFSKKFAWANTLKSLNQSDLDDSLKAKALRSFSLSQIRIGSKPNVRNNH